MTWKTLFRILVVSFFLSVPLSPAVSQTTASATLDQLLAGAQAEIDAIQAIIDRLKADPANMVAIEKNGAFYIVDRREVDPYLDIAATIISAIIEKSPQASDMVGEYFSRAVKQGTSTADDSPWAGIANMIGQATKAVVSTIASQGIPESLLKAKLAEKTEAYLAANSVTIEQLRLELELRKELYKVIDEVIGTSGASGLEASLLGRAVRAQATAKLVHIWYFQPDGVLVVEGEKASCPRAKWWIEADSFCMHCEPRKPICIAARVDAANLYLTRKNGKVITLPFVR